LPDASAHLGSERWLGTRGAHHLLGHPIGFVLVLITWRIHRQLRLNSGGQFGSPFAPAFRTLSASHRMLSAGALALQETARRQG
jgi:hypothetical protein